MAIEDNSTTGQGDVKGAASLTAADSCGASGVSVLSSKNGQYVLFAWFALCWASLFWRLSHLWRSETEQLFGFGVPVLVAWLLWQRRAEWVVDAETSASNPDWGCDALVAVLGRPDQPTATRASQPQFNPVCRRRLWLRVVGWIVVGVGAAALLLATLALEANPLWPKAAWLAVSAAFVVTLAGVFLSKGGRAVRVVAPVLALMLTALKWPAQIYEPVMHGLMQFNAKIAAELVSLSGTPAVVLGSVIEVARGMVGVDEACSGLRSLQTVVMMAFFLGEMERLRAARRVMLLAGAVLAALVVNVARTTLLTWVFANSGPEVEERWHDPAGIVALFVTLALVWLVFEYISKMKPTRAPVAASTDRAAMPLIALTRLAWRPLAVVLASVVAIEAATEAWYRSHEGSEVERVVWKLAPTENAGWGQVEVPRRSKEILRYESGESFGRGLAAPSRQLLAFAFRWEADLARNGLPELHDPLVCLPSVGAVREAELAELRVNVEGVEVPFRVIRFRQGTITQHVAFCLWGTRIGGPDTARWQGGDITAKRWERVRAGLRDDEREQLIFFVQGESSDEGARETLRDSVLTLLRRK